MKEIIQISSVSQAHEVFGLKTPGHPLVSVYQHKDMDLESIPVGFRYTLELYHVICKIGYSGSFSYGRNAYDFQDGTLIFMAPGQVVAYDGFNERDEAAGWSLLFHPDLIRKCELGRRINAYTFFSYDVHEALHVSDDEKQNLTELAQKIDRENKQNIDKHSQNLIVSNIQLFLDYCMRYYDRQFYIRTNWSKDIVSKFEMLISQYFATDLAAERGLPTVAYCGKELNMSPKYLSDMLKKETGKTAQEHIHYYLVEHAKTKLLGTSEPISQIAFSLGFDYPQHFTKIFKAKTGMSPVAFRDCN